MAITAMFLTSASSYGCSNPASSNLSVDRSDISFTYTLGSGLKEAYWEVRENLNCYVYEERTFSPAEFGDDYSSELQIVHVTNNWRADITKLDIYYSQSYKINTNNYDRYPPGQVTGQIRYYVMQGSYNADFATAPESEKKKSLQVNFSITVVCPQMNLSSFLYGSKLLSRTDEEYRKDYESGYTFSKIWQPFIRADSPMSSNIDYRCQATYQVQVTSSDGGIIHDFSTQNRNDAHYTVALYPAGITITTVFYVKYDCLVVATGQQYPNLIRIIQFKDGNELLELDAHQESYPDTIDMDSADTTNQFKAPLFKDNDKNGIQLPDPANPARSIYFYVPGQTGSSLSDFIRFEILQNTDPAYVTVRFIVEPTNLLSSFELIACYNYGSYSKLQALCDTSIKHKVTNASPLAKNLVINMTPLADVSSYEHSSSPYTIDLSQHFSSSDSMNFPLSYTRVCHQACIAADSFDANTGKVTLSLSTSRAPGTYQFDFGAFAGQKSQTFTWSITLICVKLTPDTFKWSDPSWGTLLTKWFTVKEVVIKSYKAGWSWPSEIFKISDRISDPQTISNFHQSCPVRYTLRVTLFNSGDDSFISRQNVFTAIEDWSMLSMSVDAQLGGQETRLNFVLLYESYEYDPATQQPPVIQYRYFFIDGYTRLTVDTYSSERATGHLQKGYADITFITPLFKDADEGGLTLSPDEYPSSAGSPWRSVTFQIVGYETSPLSDFFTFSVKDNNNDPTKIIIRFFKVPICSVERYDFTVIFNYAGYTNLQNLHNTGVQFKMVRAMGCTQANGVSILNHNPLNNMPNTEQSSTPLFFSLANHFSVSDVVSCKIESFSCTYVEANIDCSAASDGQVIFDTQTGALKMTLDASTRLPKKYTYQFEATAGNDVKLSLTWWIEVVCPEIDMNTLVWIPYTSPSSKDPVYEYSIYRKDYLAGGWSFSEMLQPFASGAGQLTNVDPNCPVTYMIRKTERVDNPDSELSRKNEENTDRDGIAQQVIDLPAGHYWNFQFGLNYPNYPRNVKSNFEEYLSLTYRYFFIDGYTQLQVNYFPQAELMINVATGPQNVTFTPPRFKDGATPTPNTDIELQDSSNPSRSLTFKVVGSIAPVRDFIEISVIDNSNKGFVKIQFQKQASNTAQEVRLVACYTYGSYANMKELCDDSKEHLVQNALLDCDKDVFLTLDQDKKSIFESQSYKQRINDPSQQLFKLSDILLSSNSTIVPSYQNAKQPCGNLKYKLADETKSDLITVDKINGQLSISKQLSSKYLGQQEIILHAYFDGTNPTTSTSQKVVMSIKVEIQPQVSQKLSPAFFQAQLVRRPPVALEPIAPLYYGSDALTMVHRFDFADPLAIDLQTIGTLEMSQQYEGLEPSPLRFTIISNQLPLVVQQVDTDTSQGDGFITARVICDAAAAKDQLDVQRASGVKIPSLGGSLVVEVEDTSSGGKKSQFTINFFIQAQEKQSIAEKDSESTQQVVIDISEARQAVYSMLSQKEELQYRYRQLQDGQPTVKIRKISKNGRVELRFSENMQTKSGDINGNTGNSGIRLLSSDIAIQTNTVDIKTLLKFQEMIDVEMLADPNGSDYGETRVQLQENTGGWRIANFTGNRMDIQLDFASPESVSAGGNDLVRISFRDTSIIYDWLGREVKSGSVIERYVPAQFASKEEAEAFEALEEAFSAYETGKFVSDYALNAAIAGSLQILWSQVSAQQIIVLIPLFDIWMPANAQTVFGTILQIAAFDMVPTDEAYSDMLSELERGSEYLDLVQQKMIYLGFETTWILPNLGSLLFFAGLFPLMLLLLACLTGLAKCLPSSKRIRSTRLKLRDTMFWHWPITYLRDSFVVIMICCWYNLKYSAWHNTPAIVNTLTAVSLLVLLTVYPSLMQLYLFKRKAMLGTSAFKRRYGSAYEGLSHKGRKSVYYPLLFYYRRLIVPFAVIFFPHNFVLQFICLIITVIATAGLIGTQAPFEIQSQNRSQIMQELTILAISYHSLCFTQWMADLSLHRWLGYSIILWIAGQLFITLAVQLARYLRVRMQQMKRESLLSKAQRYAKIKLRPHKVGLKRAALNRPRLEGLPSWITNEDFSNTESDRVASSRQEDEDNRRNRKARGKFRKGLSFPPLSDINEESKIHDESQANRSQFSLLEVSDAESEVSYSNILYYTRLYAEQEYIQKEEAKQQRESANAKLPHFEEERKAFTSLQELDSMFPRYANEDERNCRSSQPDNTIIANVKDSSTQATRDSMTTIGCFYHDSAQPCNRLIQPLANQIQPQPQKSAELILGSTSLQDRKAKRQMRFANYFDL